MSARKGASGGRPHRCLYFWEQRRKAISQSPEAKARVEARPPTVTEPPPMITAA